MVLLKGVTICHAICSMEWGRKLSPENIERVEVTRCYNTVTPHLTL